MDRDDCGQFVKRKPGGRNNATAFAEPLAIYETRSEAGGAEAAKPAGAHIMEYFSTTYAEARAKFLAASEAARASVEKFAHPKTGPGGEPLYTDVALLGSPDAKQVLMLGAATHGVEGFAGSAILTGLLRTGIASQLGSGIRVVMIHAINPYGFAHLRRFNEDNIDLNRNFVDHSKPYPTNSAYAALADAIAPESNSIPAEISAIWKFAVYVMRNGMGGLQSAVSGGQHTHPKGLFFGGHSETWSRRTFQEVVWRHLAESKKVAFVDFHTGLGPYGYAEVILNEPADSPAYKRAEKWWGDRVKTTKSGASVSEDVTGTVKIGLARMLPGVDVTAVSLEFGTRPSLKVFWALRKENWLHHHGGKDHPKADRIKEELLRAFYPDAEDWKERVWQQGEQVVRHALAGLSK